MAVVTEIPGIASGHEIITPGDVSTGITAGLLTPASGSFNAMNAVAGLITAENQTMHFTLDGTAPTAAAGTDLGHDLAAGDSYMIRGKTNMANFRIIDRVSGSAGQLKVTVFHAFNSDEPDAGP